MRAEQHVFNSPIGEITLMSKGDMLIRVILPGSYTFSKVSRKTERGSVIEQAVEQFRDYFRGHRQHFSLAYRLDGISEFQLRVYQQLTKISYGSVTYYQKIAEQIGVPNGSRAVGLANKRNPLPILIPCHRVIGKHGKARGFTPCISIQDKLLELES